MGAILVNRWAGQLNIGAGFFRAPTSTTVGAI